MMSSPNHGRSAPNGRPALKSIQLLRALAAVIVVVHHAGYDADTIARRLGLVPLALEAWFDWSFGIHLFFVISGFVMLVTTRSFGAPGAPCDFFVRRLIRVAPLYWLMTTLVLIGAGFAPDLLNVPARGWGLILGSYAFIPVLRVPGEIRPVLGQGWTLNYEMFFYCVFAISMRFSRRCGLLVIATILIGLVVLGRLTGVQAPPFVVWTDAISLEFLFGIGLGLIFETGRRLGLPAALSIFILGAVAAVGLGPFTGRFDGWEPVLRGGLPAAVILGACVLARPGAGAVRPAAAFAPAALAASVAAALGDASYSLYLCHPFVIRLCRNLWLAVVKDRLPVGGFLLLALGLAMAAGLVLHRLIERPMTRWLQMRWRLRRLVTAPSSHLSS